LNYKQKLAQHLLKVLPCNSRNSHCRFFDQFPGEIGMIQIDVTSLETSQLMRVHHGFSMCLQLPPTLSLWQFQNRQKNGPSKHTPDFESN
jgi:hypothetical protein